MAGDDISSPTSGSSVIGKTTQKSTYFPSPNLAHKLPMKLTSSNFLLWKTQLLHMVCGCGLNHHIDGREPISAKFLADNQLSPAYKEWVREDQLVLSWIVASVSESVYHN